MSDMQNVPREPEGYAERVRYSAPWTVEDFEWDNACTPGPHDPDYARTKATVEALALARAENAKLRELLHCKACNDTGIITIKGRVDFDPETEEPFLNSEYRELAGCMACHGRNLSKVDQ